MVPKESLGMEPSLNTAAMGIQIFVKLSFSSDTTCWKQKIALCEPKENCLVIKSITAKEKEGKFLSQQGMKLMIKLKAKKLRYFGEVRDKIKYDLSIGDPTGRNK